MRKSVRPFMSVVVICYNGADTLPAVLDSLMMQTYPKDRYEVILVDDASTDSTPKLASRYPGITYLRLGTNQGVSGARNAGLRICKGDVYVGSDDDCIADPDWLEKLAEVYEHSDPVGVGGNLVLLEANATLISRYLGMCDFYLGPRQEYTRQSHLKPWLRLVRYLKAGLQPASNGEDIVEVQELYGANSSFPVKELLAVGGWRKQMSGIEDRDICHRIRTEFPGRPFYQSTLARLTHTGGHKAGQYFMRPLRRGSMNLSFYKSVGQVPPVFPFPFLFILGCVAASYISLYWLALSLVLLPPVLYFWWPLRALRHRQPVTLLFAYFQLLEETVVMLGLLRGYASLRSKTGKAYAPEI